MGGESTVMRKAVGNALSGKGSHTATKTIFEGLDYRAAGARPEGVPHSIFQLLNHMNYWQDWVVKWLAGEKPPHTKHAADGWPDGQCPANEEEWQRAVRAFLSGLAALERQSRAADLLATRGRQSRLGMVQALASHNSYHGGQVVMLRQMLGAWPPPSGGLTW